MAISISLRHLSSQTFWPPEIKSWFRPPMTLFRHANGTSGTLKNELSNFWRETCQNASDTSSRTPPWPDTAGLIPALKKTPLFCPMFRSDLVLALAWQNWRRRRGKEKVVGSLTVASNSNANAACRPWFLYTEDSRRIRAPTMIYLPGPQHSRHKTSICQFFSTMNIFRKQNKTNKRKR